MITINKMKITNLEVFNNGEEISSWICDLNDEGEMESNGGQEFLFIYLGKPYTIQVSWDDNVINPNDKAKEVNKEMLEEGSFIYEELKKADKIKC